MDGFGLLGGLAGIILFVVVLVAGVLWVILPFAVFGIKDRLNTLIVEQRAANQMLQQLANSTKPQAPLLHKPSGLPQAWRAER